MSDESFWTVKYLEVAPASAKAAAVSLHKWQDASGRSKGHIRNEVLQRLEPANQFAIVSVWQDQAAFAADREAIHTKQSRDELAPHLIAGIDIRTHNALIGAHDTPRGLGTVFVVTHIDVPPPNKDACIELIAAHVAATRTDPGSVHFEVFRQAERPNHFSTLEAWIDRAAFDAHIITDHTREFHTKLTPLSGGLYDERIYATAG